MLFAVLGGAHGNIAALDAALARIDADGIHAILCTGNLAAGSEHGNDVIDRLRARGIACVQGELDRLTVRALRKADSLRKRLGDEKFDALQRAHDTLASSNLEFLRALPQRLSLTFEGKTVWLCCGTVMSQSTELRADDPVDLFRRQREAANTEIVVCGSDTAAFVRLIDQTLFVNPGPLDAGNCAASFAIVDTDADPMSGAIVRVK